MLRAVESGPQSGAGRAGPDGIEDVPHSLWQRIQHDPVRAPEHIALAAADHFARPADDWARRVRAHHPPVEAAALARRRHVRMSRLEGAVAGLGGAFTAVPDLGALAWIQGRMVFFVAAAYGYDPRHPMRPAELLALQDIYATPAQAREALDGLSRPLAVHYADKRLEAWRTRERQLAQRLLKLVGRYAARRVARRWIPILSAPVASAQNARATELLGARAIAYYGG
jgi:hypothetical protein